MTQKEQMKAILESMIIQYEYAYIDNDELLEFALSRIEKEVPNDEWIPVSKWWMENWKEYIIYDENDSRLTDYYFEWEWQETNPSHYMPLPNPPITK